ncbi:MAG: hypothetical protein AAF615_09145 [Pseudomonadota bacterium]
MTGELSSTALTGDRPDMAVGEAAHPLHHVLPHLARDLHFFRAPTVSALGSCAGFALSLIAANERPGFVFWLSHSYVSGEAGNIYGLGLNELVFDPAKFIYVSVPSVRDVFWCIEQAIKCEAVAAIVAEFHSTKTLELTATRRLSIRIEALQLPIYLIAAQTAPFPTTALTHWEISAASASTGSEFRSLVGAPAWSLNLTKNKKGSCREFRAAFDIQRRAFVPLGTSKRARSVAMPQAGPALEEGRGIEPVVVRLAAERRRAQERLWERR